MRGVVLVIQRGLGAAAVSEGRTPQPGIGWGATFAARWGGRVYIMLICDGVAWRCG